MAEFFRWLVSITVEDGVHRDGVTTYYVTQSEAQEYIDAADDAERAASTVGQLIGMHLAMQEGAFSKVQVGMEVINDPVPDVADNIFRGNKLLFHGRSGGRGVSWTIPCRKAASFTQLGTTLEVSLTTPAAMVAYVGEIELAVTDQFGHAIDVVSCEIVD